MQSGGTTQSYEGHYTELPFPPLTRSHILHCSYHSWYPRYRSLTPKARLIALSPSFLSYLRADGIILPPDPSQPRRAQEPDLITPPTSDDDDWDDDSTDPSEAWPDIHAKIIETIKELQGSVMPKLNWSAPKDATWINATNSMDCRNANDVYLLLKSSDFVTHDLEQVWDGCEDDSSSSSSEDGDEAPSSSSPTRPNNASETIPYHLVLRKTIPALNPSLEFRCFVRSRQLLCLCQRDLNHYSFLHDIQGRLLLAIQSFFEKELQRTFPDADFVFDVYIPEPYKRVWLIDVNPWAVRTDPLLFSWLEILTMPAPERRTAEIVRLELNANAEESPLVCQGDGEDDEEDEDEEEVEGLYTPEFRLVGRDDPEAYAFNTPQYSAHKLPKDVVDAGLEGHEGLREFMSTWRDVVGRQEAEKREDEVGEGTATVVEAQA